MEQVRAFLTWSSGAGILKIDGADFIRLVEDIDEGFIIEALQNINP